MSEDLFGGKDFLPSDDTLEKLKLYHAAASEELGHAPSFEDFFDKAVERTPDGKKAYNKQIIAAMAKAWEAAELGNSNWEKVYEKNYTSRDAIVTDMYPSFLNFEAPKPVDTTTPAQEAQDTNSKIAKEGQKTNEITGGPKQNDIDKSYLAETLTYKELKHNTIFNQISEEKENLKKALSWMMAVSVSILFNVVFLISIMFLKTSAPENRFFYSLFISFAIISIIYYLFYVSNKTKPSIYYSNFSLSKSAIAAIAPIMLLPPLIQGIGYLVIFFPILIGLLFFGSDFSEKYEDYLLYKIVKIIYVIIVIVYVVWLIKYLFL